MKRTTTCEHQSLWRWHCYCSFGCDQCKLAAQCKRCKALFTGPETDRLVANGAILKGRRGMGQKAPDSTAVPLCQGCHRYFHDHGHLPVDGYTGVVKRTIATLQAEWQESA